MANLLNDMQAHVDQQLASNTPNPVQQKSLVNEMGKTDTVFQANQLDPGIEGFNKAFATPIEGITQLAAAGIDKVAGTNLQEPVDRYIAGQQAQYNQIMDQHPVKTLAGNIVGMLAMPLKGGLVESSAKFGTAYGLLAPTEHPLDVKERLKNSAVVGGTALAAGALGIGLGAGAAALTRLGKHIINGAQIATANADDIVNLAIQKELAPANPKASFYDFQRSMNELMGQAEGTAKQTYTTIQELGKTANITKLNAAEYIQNLTKLNSQTSLEAWETAINAGNKFIGKDPTTPVSFNVVLTAQQALKKQVSKAYASGDSELGKQLQGLVNAIGQDLEKGAEASNIPGLYKTVQYANAYYKDTLIPLKDTVNQNKILERYAASVYVKRVNNLIATQKDYASGLTKQITDADYQTLQMGTINSIRAASTNSGDLDLVKFGTVLGREAESNPALFKQQAEAVTAMGEALRTIGKSKIEAGQASKPLSFFDVSVGSGMLYALATGNYAAAAMAGLSIASLRAAKLYAAGSMIAASPSRELLSQYLKLSVINPTSPLVNSVAGLIGKQFAQHTAVALKAQKMTQTPTKQQGNQ